MKTFDKELDKIINDKLHGSTDIFNQVYNYIVKNKFDPQYLLTATKKIKKDLPHFPVVINFVLEVEKVLKSGNKKALNEYLRNVKSGELKKYQVFFEKEKKVFARLNNVLIISHSKTLINIFKLWRNYNPKLKVLVCESRPLNEGILMAKELSKLKIKTEIITEAMSGKIFKEIDVVIFGADQILNNGNIINKTGSRMLAILAKYHKVPVYIIASTEKLIKTKIIHAGKVEAKLYEAVNEKKIKIRNESFEEVESKLITKILLIKS